MKEELAPITKSISSLQTGLGQLREDVNKRIYIIEDKREKLIFVSKYGEILKTN